MKKIIILSLYVSLTSVHADVSLENRAAFTLGALLGTAGQQAIISYVTSCIPEKIQPTAVEKFFSNANLFNACSLIMCNDTIIKEEAESIQTAPDGFAHGLTYGLKGSPLSGAARLIKAVFSKAPSTTPSIGKKIESPTNLNSIGGLETAKAACQPIIDYLQNPEPYIRMGAKMSKGILLYGPPGTGKTAMARALAGEANCTFLSVSGSDFIEMYVGVGAARIRELFAQARAQAPCIIFIDEFDVIAPNRKKIGGDNSELKQTINALLTEMDGINPSDKPVIVIAATNLYSELDEAVMRPGRFDHKIEISLPDKSTRKTILEIRIREGKRKISPFINLDYLANLTEGFSGAALENLVNQAALIAVQKHAYEIDMSHIMESYNLNKPHTNIKPSFNI